MLPPPAEKLQNFFGVFLQFHIGVDNEREADGTMRPLSYATFEDMHALCERLINGTALPERLSKFPIRILYGCRHKTAAMATRKGKMK